MVTQPVNNPYRPEHFDLMKTVLQSCSACKDTLERLQRAGMDVTAQLQEVNRNEQIVSNLKREFFPEMP